MKKSSLSLDSLFYTKNDLLEHQGICFQLLLLNKDFLSYSTPFLQLVTYNMARGRDIMTHLSAVN